jgi:hypothetical protein
MQTEKSEGKKSKSVLYKTAVRAKNKEVEAKLVDQFSSGRLYAVIASRPGQSGRCDGYVLEGKELVRPTRHCTRHSSRRSHVPACRSSTSRSSRRRRASRRSRYFKDDNKGP